MKHVSGIGRICGSSSLVGAEGGRDNGMMGLGDEETKRPRDEGTGRRRDGETGESCINKIYGENTVA